VADGFADDVFPTVLIRLRESAGLTVAELAEAAGLTRQAVHNYESGARRPTWDAVQKLAAALGVSTDVFRD
jgi:transcriptional regulator with XRE-family HTH domain